MLREADSIGVEELVMASAYAPVPPARMTEPAVAATSAGRYGDGARFSPQAVILTALIHVMLVAALFLVRDHIVHKRGAKLTVMNLTPAPPPPPAAEPSRPETKPVIVAPRPVVETRISSPVPLQTTPDPAPQPISLPPALPSTSDAPPAPPAPPSIVQASDLGNRMVAGKAPNYPVESRRKREQGTVVLMLILGVDGRVSSISVSQSSGFARLDHAALDAVRKWRWEPITRGGQAVMVKGLVEIPFVLQG